MKSEPGTYALVLRSKAKASIQIGRWRRLSILPGYYIYVGSAFGPGGVSARVSRHCRKAKSRRWHIDYLRDLTEPISVWCNYDPDHLEHMCARVLRGMANVSPVQGFGCTDCNCEAHLFRISREPKFVEFVRAFSGFEFRGREGSKSEIISGLDGALLFGLKAN